MLFNGYKIRLSCSDWEQVDVLGGFWELVSSRVGFDGIVGLGMNWKDDYFDYAIGVVGDEKKLDKIRMIDFSNTMFDVEYIEVHLPEYNEWDTFKGKRKDLKTVYENEIDCLNKAYDYELESFDEEGNMEIRIHFIDGKK